MQYHLNGVRTGDPGIDLPRDTPQSVDEVDVLIVGCGPAGLTLATQLCAFADISVRIIERKPGPLQFGQADGLACRSLEMFQALGFAEKVTKESYWVNEVTFWRPDEDNNRLARANRIQDVEDDLSEMPHIILSQARVHDFYLEKMKNSASRLVPDYDCELTGLSRDDHEYPVIASVRSSTDETLTTIRARYVVGCDGARSAVRRQMGLSLKGEAARQLWGVMDVLAVTNFPDIRCKCLIQSADQGSLIIIPREGGYLVRMYIELDALYGDERAGDRNLTPDALIAKAQSIFAPYQLEAKEVSWWSAYEIGQRVCDRFDDGDEELDPRIFIAGDACHTHSPKAGQGMNVSMADAYNIGWKLAAVLRGQAAAELLSTYTEERQAMAKELIDFDRDMARLFSKRPDTPEEVDNFQHYFRKHGRYTAGVETCYKPSLIISNDRNQALATGYRVGARFHSAPVVRVADAKRIELAHCIAADGRWRLILFAPPGERGLGAITQFCSFLEHDDDSPLRHFPAGSDLDAHIDTRAVFQEPHHDLDLAAMPAILLPAKGRYGLTDYEKIFCVDHKNGPNIFDRRGIDRKRGAVIIVRPDQYVAGVLALDGMEELQSFFAAILRR